MAIFSSDQTSCQNSEAAPGRWISSLNKPIRGLVADIDRFAIHDGPGIRTAVFLKGCPFRCIWCHSPETQSFAPQLLYMERSCTACGACLPVCERGALRPVVIDEPLSGLPVSKIAVDRVVCIACGACAEVCYPGALKLSGVWMDAEQLVEQIASDRPFFQASGGGVTLSGGETTCQPEFTFQVLEGCRALGIHTAIETNGCAPRSVFETLTGVVDLFLYDLKHMDPVAHRALTGARLEPVLDNLAYLAEKGATVIVRVPCIPGINDSTDNIAATAAYLARSDLKAIHLLPYNPSAGAKYEWVGQQFILSDLSPQSHETMEKLAELCRSIGIEPLIEG